MNKKEKLLNTLDERFRKELGAKFLSSFGVDLLINWNFIDNDLVYERSDGQGLSEGQKVFIHYFKLGYFAAMHVVQEAV